jgi:drug/metabolite transporter (DMT)-like permease
LKDKFNATDSSGSTACPDHEALLSGPQRIPARDLWLVAVISLTWGFNWTAMKTGVSEFPSMTFRALTLLLGVMMIGFFARIQAAELRVAREYWRELLVITLANMTVWSVLAIYGVALLSSGRAAILGYTMPIFTAVIGIVVFRERPSGRLAVGVVAAALGVVLLMWNELSTLRGSPLGATLILISAAAWGYGTHLMRRRQQPTSALVVSFWSMLISFAICALIAVITEWGQWEGRASPGGWFSLLYNGLLAYGIAQWLWFRLVSTVSPVASSLSVMSIPAIGLLSGIFVLGEQAAWQDWLALVFIVIAIATVVLPQRRSTGAR